MFGVITPEKVSEDLKMEHYVSKVIDLSATENGDALLCLLYDPLRDLVIDRIDLAYVTETAAAASTLNVGTLANNSAVVNAYATSASATAVEANNANLPLASTLQQSGRWPGSGRPILPANTRLIAKHTASGGAGEIVLVVTAYPLQRGNTNK